MSALATGKGEEFYRAAFESAMQQLGDAREALRHALPYVYNVANDRSNSPWRIETAESILALIKEVLGE